MIAPAVVTLLGILLCGLGVRSSSAWQIWSGGAVALAGTALVGSLAFAAGIPRVAYQNGEVLVYMRSLRPYRMPVEAVEVFFLGQGPALPGDDDDETEGESATAAVARNVVIRVAESQTDWHRREVRRELGRWCGGYIVIRGAWCEPVSLERLNGLNSRLAELRRQRRAAAEAAS